MAARCVVSLSTVELNSFGARMIEPASARATSMSTAAAPNPPVQATVQWSPLCNRIPPRATRMRAKMRAGADAPGAAAAGQADDRRLGARAAGQAIRRARCAGPPSFPGIYSHIFSIH